MRRNDRAGFERVIGAHAVRRNPQRHRAGLRQEVLRRILGAQPRLDRVSGKRISDCCRVKRSPRATRSCHSTRSKPVTASVTGCSTCSRVFISMKKKSPVGIEQEFDRAGADVIDGFRQRDRGRAELVAQAPHRRRARGIPRSASGGAAAPSSRARRDARRCRAGRRTPAPRCGARR